MSVGLVLANCRVMGRPPRMYLPGLLYEVMSYTAEGRYALRPCRESTELILGIYGRAQELWPSVRIHALNPLSNHITELISSPKPEDIAPFIGFVRCNIAKELRALHGLRFKVFGRRASVLPIAPDEASQVDRLKYTLAQGTKEGLVKSPRDWPGVSCVSALEGEHPLWGIWYDRTARGIAQRRGVQLRKYDFARSYSVRFSPLPCWSSLSPEQRMARITELVDSIVSTSEENRMGKPPLGVETVLAFSPAYIPEEVPRSPAPAVLGVAGSARRALLAVVRAFRVAFKAASASFRSGNLLAEFPANSFLPGGRLAPLGRSPIDLALAGHV